MDYVLSNKLPPELVDTISYKTHNYHMKDLNNEVHDYIDKYNIILNKKFSHIRLCPNIRNNNKHVSFECGGALLDYMTPIELKVFRVLLDDFLLERYNTWNHEF